jgi:hypothetical protein
VFFNELADQSGTINVMAVAVTSNAESSVIEVGKTERLFTLPIGSSFDVTRDGQRFLVNAPRDAATPPITIVLNWKAPAR